jgi:hypothetical protein
MFRILGVHARALRRIGGLVFPGWRCSVHGAKVRSGRGRIIAAAMIHAELVVVRFMKMTWQLGKRLCEARGFMLGTSPDRVLRWRARLCWA